MERQVEATLDEPRRGAFVGDGHRDHADLDPVALDRPDVQPVGGAPERAGVREPRQRLAGAVEEDPALGVEHQQHGVRDRRRVLAALLLLLAVRQSPSSAATCARTAASRARSRSASSG